MCSVDICEQELEEQELVFREDWISDFYDRFQVMTRSEYNLGTGVSEVLVI